MRALHSIRQSRADTEVEPTKLSARDKTTLVWLWSLSFLYGMMTDQMVSKVVDRPCEVRERLNTKLEVTSLMFGLVMPTVLGPLAAFIANLVLNIIEPLLAVPRWKPVKEDDIKIFHFNVHNIIIPSEYFEIFPLMSRKHRRKINRAFLVFYFY